MTDHSLGGVKEMVLGNYIIQKVEYVHACCQAYNSRVLPYTWLGKLKERQDRGTVGPPREIIHVSSPFTSHWPGSYSEDSS